MPDLKKTVHLTADEELNIKVTQVRNLLHPLSQEDAILVVSVLMAELGHDMVSRGQMDKPQFLNAAGGAVAHYMNALYASDDPQQLDLGLPNLMKDMN
jgi:hypothetical protein